MAAAGSRREPTPTASLSALLRHAAEAWPDRPALESPAASLTYGELDAAVTSAAHSLLAAGASHGSLVAFALAHDGLAYLAPFACDRAGVTGLLLNPRLAPARLAAQLATARPVLSVADDAHAARLRATGATVSPARDVLRMDGDADGAADVLALADPRRPAVALSTSGSTGDPKIVPLDGRGLTHVGMAYLDLLDLGAHERSLVVMPLHSVAVLSTQTMPMVLVGGCNVVPVDPAAATIAKRLPELAITMLDAAPAWLRVLAREQARHLPTWRTLVHGGEPMPAETLQALAARYPDVEIFDVWGLTEAHGPVTAQRYDPQRPVPAGTVGRPLPGVRVRAVGVDGPLPADEPGELQVAGPTVAQGMAGPDGWLPTGDVGVVGPDGTVTLVDRREDLILRGGLRISVGEIERELRGAPQVDDAAAFRVTGPHGTDAVGIAVVPAAGEPPDRSAIGRLVTSRIGRHAAPRVVLFLDELPRTATGKVDRQALRTLGAATACQ